MIPPRHRSQSGFALLLVFAMAAIVGIMLYLELPRVAFEAQRVREEVLIQRGEQYQRAIKLFFRRFQRYPPTIEALENTNNIRFLRRRYKDPMTGKDEWRLIHAGPGGILTDSLTQKPPQKKDGQQSGSSDTAATDTPVVSMVPRRRQSESVQLPLPGAPGAALPVDQQSAQWNPQPQDQPSQPDQSYPADPDQPAQPDQPGQTGPSSPSLVPGQLAQPGQSGYPPSLPGLQGSSPGPILTPGIQPGGVSGQGQFQLPYGPVSGPGQPPSAPPPANSSALGLGSGASPGNTPVPEVIRSMLTQPRQRPGLGGGMTIGAGIAGVASTMEAQGIKSYNDRTKYNEWEFIYDPRKDISMQTMGMQPIGAQPQPGASFVGASVGSGPSSGIYTPASSSSATRK